MKVCSQNERLIAAKGNKIRTTPATPKKAENHAKTRPKSQKKKKSKKELAKLKKRAAEERLRYFRKKLRAQEKPPAFGSRALRTLQREWYAKLAATGFEDVETLPIDSRVDALPFIPPRALKLARRQKRQPHETDLYYDRWRAYATHAKLSQKEQRLRFFFDLYADGLNLRQIEQKAKDRGIKKRYSLYWLHKTIKKYEARVISWNRTHPMGCDFIADIDPT